MGKNDPLLEGFLPLELLGRIHGASGDRPAAVAFPAAVLFVDVSRYTALVEQLARRGQEGLEQIPKLLTLSYARCAEQIGNRGGEVLYFSGDSLLAYWAASDVDLGRAVRSATDCAEAICRDQGAPQEAAPGQIGPALHVGVGAGQLWAAALGGRPVWNLIAGGDAVMQAARAQTQARRWEYVLSDGATQAIAVADTAGGEDAPCIAPPAPPTLRTEWLSGFLPPQLQDIVRTTEEAPVVTHSGCSHDENNGLRSDARLDRLAEIRPISALFARIAGLDHSDPMALARHHDLCTSLQADLQNSGGPPGELLFDDKGLVFVVAFGAHGTFHRDDPQRAVDAARAICRTAQRFGLSVSVGVATGDALFRVVGSTRRRQLMVLGPPVNRAARLMAVAADDVLCDAPTERASRATFAFERRGALQLEGLGDMAPAFRPQTRRPAASVPTSLIGRERELRFLRATFANVSSGTNSLVVVLGEPGIGKTRLVTAFTNELRAKGAVVAVAPAERDDRRTSLWAWRRVIETLLGLPADSDGARLFERIHDRARRDAAILTRLPLLADVLAVDIPQNESTRHLDGAHRADATMRLMGDIIAGAAPHPLTLVLEDSQWLDSASWRLVEWVLGSQSSLLVILCVRSEEIPEEVKSLRRRAETARLNAGTSETDDPARFCQILELDELNDASIWKLVARTLGKAPPHDELAHRISKLAGGNPFFAEEIALTLKSEGLIAIRDGLWRSIRPLDDLRYFEGVERVIRERLDRLTTAAQDVIKAAAVVGRSFTTTQLNALLEPDLDGESVYAVLETLVAAHLVRPEDQPGHYAFRHDQTRDVVYGSIPGDLRNRLHGALATWIEAGRTDAGSADAAVLVQHFEAAGNNEKAVKYADLAATNALQIGAFREVEAFVGICLSHEPRKQPWNDDQRLQAVRWRRQLAEAHYSRGDIHAQGVAVRRALKAAGAPVPTSASGTLVGLILRGARLAYQQVFPPSPDLAGKQNRIRWEREMARCLNQAATVDYFELRFSRGMCNLVGAVTHAERTGSSVETAVASAQLACGFGMMGWQRVCHHFMSRAEKVAIEIADPAIHSHVCYLDALWRLGRCDWEMVDRRLDQSQGLSLSAGDQLRWCNAQGIRFWSLYYRGDWSALEPAALTLLSRAQNAGNIQQEIWALRCKALCVLHMDRPREAVEVLRLITSAMLGSVDLAAQISARGALALALARVGRHAESVEAAVDTLRLLRAMRRPSSHSALIGISGVAEVLFRGREAGLSREYEEWGHWERQVLYELARYCRVFPVGAAQYGLWCGLAHWLDDSKERALSTWKQGLAVAKRLSLRQDEATIAAEIRRRQDTV
ncbi:AAA family ATPase [Ensifer sp. 4252]|uniref:AAA family ATPase n=1 Tax=Ensifer sp. 4252 TaxID=3373915 RepID=UPI003D216F10